MANRKRIGTINETATKIAKTAKTNDFHRIILLMKINNFSRNGDENKKNVHCGIDVNKNHSRRKNDKNKKISKVKCFNCKKMRHCVNVCTKSKKIRAKKTMGKMQD